MDKPENPYRKDSILWRLFEGDWSGKTLEQIAAELFVEEHSLYSLMSTIKSKTGYRVAYIKVPRDSSARANRTSMKKPWIKLPPSYRPAKKGVPQNCDTRDNVDCIMYARRKAVAFRHCSGWIPEEVTET